MKTYIARLVVTGTVLWTLGGMGTGIPTALGQMAEYYIGIDGRSTPFNSPPAPNGDGLPYPNNPNRGRLTFLYNHSNDANPTSNHYHGIGAYRYTGPSTAPVLEDTNANNRVPETYTGQTALPLMPGSGVYTGRLVTSAVPGVEYSNLEIRSVHSLDQTPGSPEWYLFNSSSQRWTGTFETADIHLVLLSTTPGLQVGTAGDAQAFATAGAAGVHVGDGNALFSFTPVLWTNDDAPVGVYSAEFKLVDASGTFGESGRFFIDARVVPEPAGWLLLAGLIGGFLLRSRTRTVR